MDRSDSRLVVVAIHRTRRRGSGIPSLPAFFPEILKIIGLAMYQYVCFVVCLDETILSQHSVLFRQLIVSDKVAILPGTFKNTFRALGAPRNAPAKL
jgi:hypothetical protein